MLVRAILTCFNRRTLTEAALDSFFAACAESEIDADAVVVDDGSTDGTGGALKAKFGSKVRVLRSDGSLFWAAGMALAEQTALGAGTPDPDFLLWLNDDVKLDHGSVSALLQQFSAERGIVAGAVRNSQGAITYAGFDLVATRLRFRLLPRSSAQDHATRVDTINGNVVLVSREMAAEIGPIDGRFSHAYADTDYGLRAKQAGQQCFLVSGTVGTCEGNPLQGVHWDPKVRLPTRIVSALGKKGVPIGDSVRFLRRHGGLLWPLNVLNTYVRVFFPRRWA